MCKNFAYNIKNKGHYHHNANDRFGFNNQLIISTTTQNIPTNTLYSACGDECILYIRCVTWSQP